MRDDFSLSVKETLAKRVGMRCSRCGKLTTGPQENPNRVLNIGVAAHITAAAPRGPRFVLQLSSDERQSAENGIWLCQSCAKLIDNDPQQFPETSLRAWKANAEARALQEIREELKEPRRFPPNDAIASKSTYIAMILDRCGRFEHTFRGSPMNDLKETTYIHKQLRETVTGQVRAAGGIELRHTHYDREFLDALNLHRKLVVVAPAGRGKTSLLYWAALTFARRLEHDPDAVVPIYIPLRSLMGGSVTDFKIYLEKRWADMAATGDPLREVMA
jgi:hypothetical protein